MVSKKLIPPVIWAGFIFYLSSIPSLKSPFGIWDLYLRKSAHIIEYLILSLLIFPNFRTNNIRSCNIAVLISMLYAVSDEYHQSFVPGRSMEITDMAWDWIGCMIAYIILLKRNFRAKVCSSKA